MTDLGEYELVKRPGFHTVLSGADSIPSPNPGDNNDYFNDLYNHDTRYTHDSEPQPLLKQTRTGSSRSSWFAPTLAHQVTGGNHDEKTKIALKKTPAHLLLTFLIHLVPILITVGVVLPSFLQVYWFDVEDQKSEKVKIFNSRIGLNEFLNGMQFLAKIHEILMVGSLSAIVLHFAKHILG